MRKAAEWTLTGIVSVVTGAGILYGVLALDSTIEKVYHKRKAQRKAAALTQIG